MAPLTVPDTREAVYEILGTVMDPEIPVISVVELGIIRDAVVEGDLVRVTVTPTYSGCPATRMIEELVIHVVRKAGLTPQVETRLTPAWTTDWISERGRARLKEFGIAPPGEKPEPEGSQLLTLTVRQVACPLCGSNDTEEISRFGSTACKALRRCRSCREPFDEFKAI